MIEVKFQGQRVSVHCFRWVRTLLSHAERGSSVCENRVTRKIFGLKTDKVAADWRKQRNAELRDFYPSPNINPVIK